MDINAIKEICPKVIENFGRQKLRTIKNEIKKITEK
jgi:hypothetical protein